MIICAIFKSYEEFKFPIMIQGLIIAVMVWATTASPRICPALPKCDVTERLDNGTQCYAVDQPYTCYNKTIKYIELQAREIEEYLKDAARYSDEFDRSFERFHQLDEAFRLEFERFKQDLAEWEEWKKTYPDDSFIEFQMKRAFVRAEREEFKRRTWWLVVFVVVFAIVGSIAEAHA